MQRHRDRNDCQAFFTDLVRDYTARIQNNTELDDSEKASAVKEAEKNYALLCEILGE